jgi:hypothetical protein
VIEPMMRLRRNTLLATMVVAWTAPAAHAQWQVTPSLAVNVAGDVEHGKGGPGVSAGYVGDRLGFEIELQRYQHFFKDAEVVPLDPSAPPNCRPGIGGPCVDINTDAIGVMGNVVLPIRIHGAPKWRPFGSAGFGLIRAWTNEEGRAQNDLAFDVGGGLAYALSARIGLRGDLRYVQAFVDEKEPDRIRATDYGFARASIGVTFGFGR